MPDAIYTAESCQASYQLRWSLALFSKAELPPTDAWRDPLSLNVERDGVRLLEHQFKPPNVWLFLLSSQTVVSPAQIVKSVKGRLQHLIRAECPNAFRRNFSLASVGDVRRGIVEQYVADQLGHHKMADPKVQERLARFQIAFPDVDLSVSEFSAHARYVCNLHLVLVHDRRWCEIREKELELTREMIIGVSEKKGHRLSRLALCADHWHATLGFRYDQSPQSVALGYMNNLAYAHGMKEIYRHGYYVGTFGEYDMGAIWRT
jgi:REP element-mobilizing transposase RayT